MKKLVLVCAAAALLHGCSAGIKKSPGMKLYSAGDYEQAIPMLEQEIADGEVSARYSLGLAYRDGMGVEVDAEKAEILLTGAAIGGDPRAITAIREILAIQLCEKDAKLRSMWGNLGTMNRNLITGDVELHNAPRAILRDMADIYENPCSGRPVQKEAADSLRALSMGERTMWIYVPG